MKQPKGENVLEKQEKTTDKLTDKAFSRFMLTSVLGILVCIMCLCSATWAWFSSDVSTNSNTLGSGRFDLDVFVADSNSDPVDVTQGANGNKICTLPGDETYTVTLTITDDTTVKGFCIVTVNGESYSTKSINIDDKTLTFKLDIQAADATVSVSFAPAWGLPSDDDLVESDDVLIIGAAADSAE